MTIALLVGIMLSAMILLFTFERSFTDKVYFKELARDNLESGMLATLYSQEEIFGKFRSSLYDSEVDSYYVYSYPWGMYAAMHVTGKHGPESASATYLLGVRPEDAFRANLVLKDRNRPLSLSGKTRLMGKLYLPEKGLKRGLVGRTNYNGDRLHYGQKLSAKSMQPKVEYKLLDESKLVLSAIYRSGHAAGETTDFLPDTISGNWEQEPLTYNFSSPIRIEGQRISGNCVIMAPEVRIGPGAQLENTLIYGAEVTIESGFSGKVQVFATDSLSVEDEVELVYPSALFVSHPDNNGQLIIGENCKLNGTIINDAAFLTETPEKGGYTVIGKKTEITGNVYVPYNLDLKGTVHGSVITQNFLLRTSSSVYENYLLDARVDNEWDPDQLGMGWIIGDDGNYQVMERLEE